jgi:hypothetical protein
MPKTGHFKLNLKKKAIKLKRIEPSHFFFDFGKFKGLSTKKIKKLRVQTVTNVQHGDPYQNENFFHIRIR